MSILLIFMILHILHVHEASINHEQKKRAKCGEHKKNHPGIAYR